MEDDKRKLAELAELCGLERKTRSDFIDDYYSHIGKDDYVSHLDKWNPLTNTEQAMIVLKAFDMWKIECVDDLYFCQISKLSERCDGYEILGAVQLETLCEAICYACLCAKERR